MFYCTLFFFNDTATTEIYTLSLHDALPIFLAYALNPEQPPELVKEAWETGLIVLQVAFSSQELDPGALNVQDADRKSTRLNSSHANISYAVFCLKNKNKNSNSIHL